MAANLSRSGKFKRQSHNKNYNKKNKRRHIINIEESNNVTYNNNTESNDIIDDYISLADISERNGQNIYNEYGSYTYDISKPTVSTQVERSTPFPLINEPSNISNLFAINNDNICDNTSDNISEEYAPTETTRTATFKDNRSRRLSDEYVIDIDYNEIHDSIPDIINEIDTKQQNNKNNKKKIKKKSKKSKKKSRYNDMNMNMDIDINESYETMSIKYNLDKPILIDTPSTQTHAGYNKNYRYKKYNNISNISMNNRSFSASEYSSESPHITTHITGYNTINTINTYTINTNTSKYSSINMGLIQSDSNNVCMDEMDEDFYDLLSDAICDLFIKLDTRNKKAVNYDIIKIGFTLLDINLTDNQFNMFINELTNFRSHKMIKYDMLRSFILNIQNKNYNYKLKQIRMIIIDGLLSQPLNRGHSLNDTNIHTNTNTNNRHNRNSTHSTMTTYKKHKKAMSTLSTLPSMNSMQNLSKEQEQKQNKQKINKSDPTIPILATDSGLATDSTIPISQSPSMHSHSHSHSHLWRAHITDHDENGPCQYDLLLCTLKYSLISTTIDLYNNAHLLDINYDKFYMYIKNQQQKQALSYLFSCFFNFMGNYIEYMSLKTFESGLKNCGITFDRHDITIISFGQLSSAFTGSGSKNTNKKHKKSKLFITQNSFVSWLLKTIYSKQNTNYKNYTKHSHQYYKWIENDLFSLVNPTGNIHKIRKKNHSYHFNHNNKIRKKHKSHNYHNPVVIPKTKKKQKHKKRRHKSHQIQIQQHHHNDIHNYSDHNYSDII